MLSYLFKQLFRSLGVFFRTIRAFFTRKLMGAVTCVRRFFNVSRHAARAAAGSFQAAAAAVKKPAKREDYIETRRLFISKSFLVLLAIFLVGLGLLLYFVAWPFVLSRFLTARFYREDQRLPDWSGRVVVYYDEAKRVPMYSGRLTDGVLEGRGSAYDEQGLLCYEGSFSGGAYSGSGRSYENGVLVYEGQFREGVYDGAGSLYEEGALVYQGSFSAGEASGLGVSYLDGEKRYEGSFRAGLPHGEGTEYYPGGGVSYKGSFADGEREGMGTIYYPEGGRSYTGSFSQGLREGEGTAYRPGGQTAYKGGFSQDLYEGQGCLYLEDGGQVEAEFTAGETAGTIRWYRSGKLWYEGGAQGLVPDGFGTIYGEDGRPIYAGELDRGTVDGAWLLERSAGEVREIFGSASITEEDRGDGFWMGNTALGLWVLCGYQSEDSPAQVRQVWFRPGQGKAAALIPWRGQEQADAWAREGGGSPGEGRALPAYLAAPVGAGGGLEPRTYAYQGGYTCALLYAGGESAPAGLSWTGGAGGGTGGAAEGTASRAQERLEALAASLEQMGGGSGGSVDRGDVARLVALMFTAQDAQTLIDALTEYLLYGGILEALETERPLLERQAAGAQAALERGTGGQAAVDSAQEALDGLTRRLAQYETGRKQARETVLELCGLDPADYALGPVLINFDPAELDARALYDAALDYAREVAAGRYEVEVQDLEDRLRETALELGMRYESMLSQRRSLERRIDALEEQTGAYAKGTAGQDSLYSAQCALCECLVELYEETGRFNQLANRLNTLSGGWVSEVYGWLEAPLGEIFQGEIVRGKEAAAALERERAQREEEAARALEEAREALSESPPPEETAESAPPEPADPAQEGE